jgi:hypothetical protein
MHDIQTGMTVHSLSLNMFDISLENPLDSIHPTTIHP